MTILGSASTDTWVLSEDGKTITMDDEVMDIISSSSSELVIEYTDETYEYYVDGEEKTEANVTTTMYWK